MLDTILKWVVGLLLVSALPALYYFTISAGKEEFLSLAVEFAVCEEAESCTVEDEEFLASSIVSQSEYSSKHQIQWCLGVDTWANTRVRRGGWIVGILMDVGYWFCPAQE